MQKCFLSYGNDGFVSIEFTYPKQNQEYLYISGFQNTSVIHKVELKTTNHALCTTI